MKVSLSHMTFSLTFTMKDFKDVCRRMLPSTLLHSPIALAIADFEELVGVVADECKLKLWICEFLRMERKAFDEREFTYKLFRSLSIAKKGTGNSK